MQTDQDLYKEVKRASDSFLGIPSQCLVAERAGIGGFALRKSRDFKEVNRRQYCANVSLKVNAKLDGTNATLATIQPWQLRPYMLMGAPQATPISPSGIPLAVTCKSLMVHCPCPLLSMRSLQFYKFTARFESRGWYADVDIDTSNVVEIVMYERWSYGVQAGM